MNERAYTADRLRNWFSSLAILGGLTGLLTLVGYLVGGELGVVFALGMSVAPVLFNSMSSAQAVLRLHHAVPLAGWQAPGLHRMVTAIASAAGLPAPPRLYLIDSPALNALTVGSQESSAVAVTRGLLVHLEPAEVAGVIAHEVAHLRHNDLWIMAVAASFARLTHWLSMLGQLLVLLSLPLILLGDVNINIWLFVALALAPGASALLQLAMSRTREYEADLGAAQLLGSPLPLASALGKLDRLNRPALLWGRARHEEEGVEWLRTHPSTRDRIERLVALAAAERYALADRDRRGG